MLTRCARNCRQVGIERGRVGSVDVEKRKKDVKSQKNRKQYEKRKRKSKSTQAAVKPEAPLSFPDHISSVGVGQSSMREDVVMADENQLDGQRRLLKKPPNPRAWRRRRLRALRKKSPQSRQMRLKIRQPSNQIPLRLFLVDNDSHVDL